MSTIKFVGLNAATRTFDYADRFAPRKPTGKYKLTRWIDRTLQTLVFGLAKRRKWYAPGSETTYTRTTINTDSVITNIEKQHRLLLRDYNQRGGVVLIGPEHLQLSLREIGSLSSPVAFTHYYEASNEKTGYKICGMKVVVVPWMTGVLVVPMDVLDGIAPTRNYADFNPYGYGTGPIPRPR